MTNIDPDLGRFPSARVTHRDLNEVKRRALHATSKARRQLQQADAAQQAEIETHDRLIAEQGRTIVEIGPPTDPPSAAPVLLLSPHAVGALVASWTPIPDASEYDVHVSAVAGTPPGPDTLALTTTATSVVLTEDASGDSLTPFTVTPVTDESGDPVYVDSDGDGTPDEPLEQVVEQTPVLYAVRVVPRNSAGAGPVSNEAQASLRAAPVDLVVTEELLTRTVEAVSARLQSLTSDLVTSGTIATAMEGARVVLSGQTITIYGRPTAADPEPLLFGINDAGELRFVGAALLSTLEVARAQIDRLTVPSQITDDDGSTIVAGSIQLKGEPTAPRVQPALVDDWHSVPLRWPPSQYDDWVGIGITALNGVLHATRKRPGWGATWAVQACSVNVNTGAMAAIGSVTGIEYDELDDAQLLPGGRLLTCGRQHPSGGERRHLIRHQVHSLDTGERMNGANEVVGDTTYRSAVAVRESGAVLVVRPRQMDGRIVYHVWEQTGGPYMPGASGFTNNVINTGAAGVYDGRGDLGVARTVIAPAGAQNVQVMNNFAGDHTFAKAEEAEGVQGFTFHAGHFWHISGGRLVRYENPAAHEPQTWAVAYTNGTATTKIGPTNTIDPPGRNRVVVRWAKPPSGTTHARLYAGPAGGPLRLQATVPAATTTWTQTPAYSTSGPLAPTVSTFPTGGMQAAILDRADAPIITADGVSHAKGSAWVNLTPAGGWSKTTASALCRTRREGPRVAIQLDVTGGATGTTVVNLGPTIAPLLAGVDQPGVFTGVWQAETGTQGTVDVLANGEVKIFRQGHTGTGRILASFTIPI